MYVVVRILRLAHMMHCDNASRVQCVSPLQGFIQDFAFGGVG